MTNHEWRIPHPWWHCFYTMRAHCSITESGVPYSELQCNKCKKIYIVYEPVVNYERVNIYENSKGK